MEILLTGACVALSISLMVEKAKNADLKDRVKNLKRQLYAAQVKGKQDVLAANADAHTDIALLQLQLFQAKEEICTLRTALARKNNLISQKWKAAKEES